MRLLFLLLVWATLQSTCLVMLWIGSQVAGHRLLQHLGQIAHKRKLAALNRIWPLTLIRPALVQNDVLTCAVVLSSLIVLKSVACLMLGCIVAFWLPFASLLVPSIVAVHKPGDLALRANILKVAAFQVTSHALAAALGFSIVSISFHTDVSLVTTIADLSIPIIIGSTASIGLAIAAGKYETNMLFRHGL